MAHFESDHKTVESTKAILTLTRSIRKSNQSLFPISFPLIEGKIHILIWSFAFLAMLEQRRSRSDRYQVLLPFLSATWEMVKMVMAHGLVSSDFPMLKHLFHKLDKTQQWFTCLDIRQVTKISGENSLVRRGPGWSNRNPDISSIVSHIWWSS